MNARFHLPGLRFNYPLNMFIVSMREVYPQYFRDNLEIASFFGEFPTSLWAGGRFALGDQCDSKFIHEVIKNINAKGIPIRYTFTNPLLTEEDLKDPYCNYLMDEANNGMNEVIVYSPILEQYIREKYPKFKINSTTCKEIKSIEGLEAELAKDYKMVVLDQNLNNQWDLISQLSDKKRVEVLVNACCVPNCPRRADHYKTISQQTRLVLENRKVPFEQRTPLPGWHCEYGDHNTFHTIQDSPTFISPDAIWEKYMPMGFNNFKVEGRTANLFSLCDTYSEYLFKPEYKGKARLLLLANLEHSGIIKVNKPRPSRWP